MKKRILIVEGKEDIGGGQVMTKKIAECLRNNHHVVLFLPGNENSPISKFLDDFDQRYYKNIPYKKGKKHINDYLKFFANLFCIIFRLYKVLKEDNIDIIYIQHLSLLPAITLINLINPHKTIAHVHVIYVDLKVRWMLSRCLMSKHIMSIISVSDFAASQFNGFLKNKMHILYNPVCVQKQINHDAFSKKIAIIGDVQPLKGHHLVFEAIRNTHKNYNIHIIGNIVDNDYRNGLETNYSDVSCTFTGMIQNVYDYLLKESIDLTIIPSVGPETFSLAMVESWAAGIPTIATNDYGMKELVNKFLKEENGYLLFEKNDAQDLAAKINILETQREKYMQISKKIWCVVNENFNMEIFSNELLKLT